MPYIIEEQKVSGYREVNGSLLPIIKTKLKYVGKKINEKETEELINSLYMETLNIQDKEELEEYLEDLLDSYKLDICKNIQIILTILQKRKFI